MINYTVIIKYYTHHKCLHIHIFNTNFLVICYYYRVQKKEDERKSKIVFNEKCEKISQNRENLQIFI